MTAWLQQQQAMSDLVAAARAEERQRILAALRLKASITDDRLEGFRNPEREAPRLGGASTALREAIALVEAL